MWYEFCGATVEKHSGRANPARIDAMCTGPAQHALFPVKVVKAEVKGKRVGEPCSDIEESGILCRCPSSLFGINTGEYMSV